MHRRSALGALLYIVLSAIGIATATNAPGIGYGYGLVVSAGLYAVWAFSPLEALAYMLVAHSLALYPMLVAKSVFMLVAVLSLVLRPLIAGFVSFVKTRGGLSALSAGLLLVSLDSLLAITIAILYYGDDGIHAGLSLYSFLLLPVTYPVYRAAREVTKSRLKPLYITASLFTLLAYYLSLTAFLSIPLLIASIASLAVLYASIKRRPSSIAGPATAILILAVGFISGGSAAIFNAKLAFYAFTPENWGSGRWLINNSICGYYENVMKGVYDPERLRIVQDCVAVRGVVIGLPIRYNDGDYCFDLKLLEKQIPLSLGSYILRKNTIHAEIVPEDQERLLGKIGGLCPGDVVEVVGPYVVDTDHGLWGEIHPVLKLNVIKRRGEWPTCIWSYVEAKAKEIG